jgi:hypothetical protein
MPYRKPFIFWNYSATPTFYPSPDGVLNPARRVASPIAAKILHEPKTVF